MNNPITAPNVAFELEKLDELRKKGLITDAEFDARKKQMFAAPSNAGKPKFRGWLLPAITLAGAFMISAAYNGNPVILFAAMFGIFIYLLPAYIAYQRFHQSRLAIAVINIFLGWSFLGWVGALIWSCTAVKREQSI